MNEKFKKICYVGASIPKEMFWAYETVRKSGIYNMAGFIMPMCETKISECLQIISDCYMQYIIYTGVDLEKEPDLYKKVTRNHIRLIQECYNECLEGFGNPPEGVIHIEYQPHVSRISIG